MMRFASWGMGKACQLSDVERQKIQQWTAAHGTPRQVALRRRIVLAAAAGASDVAIAERLSVNRNTVILRRKRFGDEGLDGLWDIAPGRGRKPVFQIDKIAAIVDATLQTKPAGMTHWSCRTMAQSQGVSKSTVTISGAPTIYSHIAQRPLSFRAIRSFWKK